MNLLAVKKHATNRNKKREKMNEQPTKPETAEIYEQTRRAYWEAFSTMNSSRFIASG